MSWWARLRAALGREAAEATDLIEATEARLDADLRRREADLVAGPDEQLARTLEEIAAEPDPFAEIRARIEPQQPSEEA